ncbi:MAG: hypothetical protein KDC75_22645, partial [Phaeodactylibacter sp.]|nr:hypothetical protein [Phaeodactylibacter sp.]
QGEDETTGGAERHVQKQKIFILQSTKEGVQTRIAPHFTCQKNARFQNNSYLNPERPVAITEFFSANQDILR